MKTNTIFLSKLKNTFPKLSQTESNRIEGLLTEKKVLSLFKKMKNDKTNGPDGFTCEFFKVVFERYWLVCYQSN